jgi:hypothetical protein
MMSFFEGMESLLRIYWYIAIPVSLIFAIQTIMTFTVGDAGDGLDADFDGDLGEGNEGPSQLFSIRNLINFLLGFSWSGISLYDTIETPWILNVVAVIIGLSFVSVFFLVMRQVQKLAENNSFSYKQTIGVNAEVYLTIPGEKAGKGKVSMNIKGSHRELDAITEGETIETGSLVTVQGVAPGNLLIVSKL